MNIGPIQSRCVTPVLEFEVFVHNLCIFLVKARISSLSREGSLIAKVLGIVEISARQQSKAESPEMLDKYQFMVL